jgi:hypothetical protein
MEILFVAVVVCLAFGAGVWLAPMLRGDYFAFKAFVEGKLQLAETKAREKAIGIVNKL